VDRGALANPPVSLRTAYSEGMTRFEEGANDCQVKLRVGKRGCKPQRFTADAIAEFPPQ